jgi:hypothetical protein
MRSIDSIMGEIATEAADALHDDLRVTTVHTTPRACPFCLHGCLKVVNAEYGPDGDDYKGVLCLNCWAQGPIAANEETAWARWNESAERHVFDPDDGACVCSEMEPGR